MLGLEKAYMTKLRQIQDQRKKIEANHKFAEQWFSKSYSKVKHFRETILEEKVAWEQEQIMFEQELQGTFGPNRLVSLDVGGTHRITTNLDLLTAVEGSMLAKMFSGRHDVPKNEKGNVFLDRDGETFLTLVNYLRNYRRALPKLDSLKQETLFLKELEFWQMEEDYVRYKNYLSHKYGDAGPDGRTPHHHHHEARRAW